MLLCGLLCRICFVLLYFVFVNCANDEQLAINIPYLLVESPPNSGHYVQQNLSSAPNTSLLVDDDHVLFYFFSRRINGTRITRFNLTNINFDASKETIVVIHGWMSSSDERMAQSVKDAYLEVEDINVIVVDWSNCAMENYVTVRFYVSDVGKVVSDWLLFMAGTVGLNLNKTGIVGHSLGAHVAGVTGWNLNSSLNHIVGLDPAGPLFYLARSRDKLDPSDAQFVEVIHTCAGYLGYPYSLGDSDYWPNGGYPGQPGCGADLTGSCSHSRSFEYYSESLISGGFRSRRCRNYLAYNLRLCNPFVTAYMGEDATDRSDGNFYLKTNSQPPYARF